ncbi:hypothetical protein [Oleisolibacter albus]|uniref:hypothetical protein n=1 Tax=Oleisolibacter albus TaxID=2171757 RepID=UPI0012D7B975|nr:hypothetical protein [Oleisolibacter albus]
MARTAFAPALATLLLCSAVVPSAAQDPLSRPGDAPRAATSAADPCEVYYNVLTLRIDPGQSGIPALVRPFTDVGEWPEEQLDLYQRCRPMLEAPPALVTWTGAGPGLKPLGERMGSEAMVERQPERPGLPNSTAPDSGRPQSETLPGSPLSRPATDVPYGGDGG